MSKIIFFNGIIFVIIYIEVIRMNKEKRNQYIIIGVIFILLISVILFILYSVLNSKSINKNNVRLKLQQIYSSDYKLRFISDKYYIGSYEENKINIIIDNNGKEIYSSLDNIYYDSIYPLNDGSYLIYNTLNNALNAYVFDGKSIRPYYKIADISDVKPLLFKDKKREYIIGFISDTKEKSYIIPLDNTGIIPLEDSFIVADKFENDIYYTYDEDYLVVKNEKGFFGIVNKNGQKIIDLKYKDLMNIGDGRFIVQNKNKQYGIMDKDGELLIKFNYKLIMAFNDYFILVDNKDRMALYDKNLKNISGFSMKYDDLIEFDLRQKSNSVNLNIVGNNVFIANNYLENINGTEFSQHNLYILNNGKVIKTVKQRTYGIEDIIYTLDLDNNINLYNKRMDVIISFKIDDLSKLIDIKSINDSTVRIVYIDKLENQQVKYYNLDGEEVNSILGDLIIKNAIYSAFVEKDGSQKKLSIYNDQLDKIDSISGSYLEVLGEYIIADNSIYKIVVSS